MKQKAIFSGLKIYFLKKYDLKGLHLNQVPCFYYWTSSSRQRFIYSYSLLTLFHIHFNKKFLHGFLLQHLHIYPYSPSHMFINHNHAYCLSSQVCQWRDLEEKMNENVTDVWLYTYIGYKSRHKFFSLSLLELTLFFIIFYYSWWRWYSIQWDILK